MTNKEMLMQNDGLLGRVLNRQVFAWPEESPTTIRKKIALRAQNAAEEKIITLNQSIALKPSSVIEKVSPRADSWQYLQLLGHITLKWMSRLSVFSNLPLVKKPI